MRTKWKLLSVCASVMLALIVTAGVALAFTQSNHITFTLEGCRNDGTITLPILGKFVCPDAAYTTGNLGKGWNELDLVPHRLTTAAGNQDGVTTTYDVYVAADYQTNGHLGYDVISVPVVNTAKSDPSCSVTPVDDQLTKGSATSPFGGGTDIVVYRQLMIQQARNTTCVFDYYQRLALGAHLYPGSSLQSYMFDQDGLSGSKKTISIPVNQILPQELSKTMTAQQDVDHAWTLSKKPSPASLNFGNTCDAANPAELALDISIKWTKGAATPAGQIRVDTYITAKNPASRVVTVNVTDVIYSGTTALDTSNSGDVDVPANTSLVVLQHTFMAPSGTTNLNDIATATYTDKITGVPIPGTTTATASAAVQTGTELNSTASITDSESITGTGLDFKVAAPLVGTFNGYTAGDWTTGPVNWDSGTLSSSSSVTFNKTVRVSGPITTTGKITDTATLTTSGAVVVGPETLDVDIQSEALATLTITKTIPDILNGAETASFTFHVYNASNNEIGSGYKLNFAAGDTTKSTTVSGLVFGAYKVTEDKTDNWTQQDDQNVTISGCAPSVKFANVVETASAKVKKVTVPAGFEAGWTFNLKDSGGTVIGTAVTTGAGFVNFSNVLQSGTYSIVEQAQTGWTSDGGDTGCAFTVDLPTDSNKVFACTFTNTYNPAVTLDKTGDALSKIGDSVNYTITLTNTSLGGGAAGTPKLACTISDPTIGFTKNVTLAAGDTDTSNPTFTIPVGAADPFVNKATAECTYVGLTDVVASSDSSWSTNLFQPSITFAKTADTLLSKAGDTVNYTLTLNNTSSSDSPDLVCSITDAMLAVDKKVTLVFGTNDVTKIAYTVKATDADPLLNTAYVSCSPVGFPNVLKADGTVSVNLFQPSVKVTKTGPAYSKAGDTATFTVTITNTSSADAPNLVLDTFTDTLVTGVTPPTECNNLAPAASCTFSYNYVVLAADPDPLVNTATAHFHPAGYTNDITDKSTVNTDLVHPSFTATKVCKAGTEPILQAGPAVFTITVKNTGDADLHVVPSEGVAFDIAAGASKAYDYSVAGPFSATVNNTVTGTVTLATKYALANSYELSASGSCIVQGKAKVIKTVNGQVPATGQTFTFELRKGASTLANGSILETRSTDATGNIAFSTTLIPGQIYQICEWVYPGWNTNLAGDSPLFVPGSNLTPTLPNPNVNNLVVCTDFTVTSGQTRAFNVDNTPPPGGRALTIGFWKNWASCTTSSTNKKWYLDLALGMASASTSNPPAGLVVSAENPGTGWPNYAAAWDLVLKGNPASTSTVILKAPDCTAAVNLLNKTTINGGKKKASDPLFNMAAQLVAAELNRFSGAGISGPAITDINKAVLLLGKYHFNGLVYSPKLTAADTAFANCLATQLDNYNNNRTVTSCP